MSFSLLYLFAQIVKDICKRDCLESGTHLTSLFFCGTFELICTKSDCEAEHFFWVNSKNMLSFTITLCNFSLHGFQFRMSLSLFVSVTVSFSVFPFVYFISLLSLFVSLSLSLFLCLSLSLSSTIISVYYHILHH